MRNKDKILVSLQLPASAESYDVSVPRHIKVGEMKGILIEYLRSKEDTEFIPDEDAVLCDRDTGAVLSSNAFVAQSGIREGARLIMI